MEIAGPSFLQTRSAVGVRLAFILFSFCLTGSAPWALEPPLKRFVFFSCRAALGLSPIPPSQALLRSTSVGGEGHLDVLCASLLVSCWGWLSGPACEGGQRTRSSRNLVTFFLKGNRKGNRTNPTLCTNLTAKAEGRRLIGVKEPLLGAQAKWAIWTRKGNAGGGRISA